MKNNSDDDFAGTIRELLMAYRYLALLNPLAYSLMSGQTIPGYKLNDFAGKAADNSFLILLKLR
ncbi:MAG: hypothetical protein WCP19_07095 [Chloroflexota bacterium]